MASILGLAGGAVAAAYRVDLDAGPTPSGEDLKFGPVTFYRRKSPDGLLPTVFDPDDGGSKAVRLAVRAGAYAGPLTDPSDCGNDRCELRGPQQPLGTEVWHAFSIRVPADFPVRPLRCVVAQMKMPYDSGGDGSPAVALRIDAGRWVVTVEHLFEVDDFNTGRFLRPWTDNGCPDGVPANNHSNFNKHVTVTDYQVRAFIAPPATELPAHVIDEITDCTIGVSVESGATMPNLQVGGGWTDFVLHVHASGSKDVGLIELFANGVRVVRATGRFGYPDIAFPAVQYFKLGPYRNNEPGWGNIVAALDYRAIRSGPTAADVAFVPGDGAAIA